MEDQTYAVMLFGKHYTAALEHARSLHAAGYDVYYAFPGGAARNFRVAASSKCIRRSIYANSVDTLKDFRAVINAKKVLLLPVDDAANAFIDRETEALKEAFVLANPEEGLLTTLMRKDFQNRLAIKAGFCVPEFHVFNLNTPPVLPEKMPFPCFCKPLSSTSGAKQEQRKCDTPEELLAHLNALREANPDREILVERFIHIEREYSVDGMSDGHTALLPDVIIKTETCRCVAGVTLTGEVRRFAALPDADEIEKQLRAFLAYAQYTGVFDVELMLAEGEIWFNEINLRPGAHEYAVFKAGVNLPAAVADAVLKGISPKPCEIHKPYAFVNERMMYEDLRHGCRTQNDAVQIMKRVRGRLIQDNTDPMPGINYQRKMLGDKLRSIKQKKG